MPFGLKNGPGIFQRAMDNILREFVGKICHVYIDDIIVYSESLEAYIEHLETLENGRISQNLSKKTEIKLDDEAIEAFERLKKLLINQVELTQPDFSKKFVLTTDASNIAIGGVLTQEVIKQIDDRLNLGEKVMDVLQSFPNARKMTLDNEPGFTTVQFKSLMQRLGIELYYCTPRHSTTNGIVERVHSTLVELARCIKEEYHVLDDSECFYRATQQYNKSIHSVTGEKPSDIFFNKILHDNLVDKLKKAQEKMLQRSRDSTTKTYQPNAIVYEKIIGQRNKLAPRFRKQKS
ncbi:Retrovirus-related Pol polyprotein from transposon gypsy [Eumeta japonica]|uniref:Retrovirus-related Pol polyprotein from transposon gypsy n=1 Tax=Eumeta variegata TaxID=151549 RepID=A0A4C1TFE7_EUMVA|nr:Retrovirus-related Pol polyprotein from transposon gypsy [Eumeta japonica]